jgi:hypothetical protein
MLEAVEAHMIRGGDDEDDDDDGGAGAGAVGKDMPVIRDRFDESHTS